MMLQLFRIRRSLFGIEANDRGSQIIEGFHGALFVGEADISRNIRRTAV
jgi:hypothetical protein